MHTENSPCSPFDAGPAGLSCAVWGLTWVNLSMVRPLPWTRRGRTRRAGRSRPLTQAAERLLADTSVRQDTDRLAKLIALAERAVAEEGPGETSRRWSNLGVALWWLYQHGSDVEVLRRSVGAMRVAAQEIPRDDPVADTMLANLAQLLAEQYRAAGDLAALDEALSISAERVAGAITPESWLTNPMNQLEKLLRYAEEDDVKQLPGYRQAAQAHAMVLAKMASAGEQLAAVALERRDPGLLTSGIQMLEKALAAAAGSDREQRAQWQFDLAWAHAIRWELTADPDALNVAIEAFQGAISMEPAAQLRASCYVNLALACTQRYQRADGQPGDLDVAVAALELAAPPDGDPGLMREWQGGLQGTLWNRYEVTADLADLDRAIEIGRSLVAGGAVADSSHDEAMAKLRRLLMVRQAFQADSRVSEEIAALSRAPSDADDPDPEEGLLGWVRTYD